ncbi:MAG TPA: hypothetical protein VEY67_01095 [Candidatus Dormibacteraeota bacterium]|nr:hypothetical protein [Candidatus Dormibacteraeota bacterium]
MAMFDTEPVAPEPAPVVRRPASQPPRRSAGTALVLGVAAVVAVGGLAFAAGRLTAPTAIAASNTGAGNGGGGNGGGGNGNGFGNGNGGGFGNGGGGLGGGTGLRGAGGFGLRGTVTAVASDHLTIQLANGTTINVPVTASTTYHQEQAGSASDVQVGRQVQIQLTRPTGATASPGADASPGASGGPRFGAASDVIVLPQ